MTNSSRPPAKPRLPAQKRIHAILVERIARRIYPQDHYLPSERAFAEEFKVDRKTVRLAIARLQKEGLVQVFRNRGALVNSLPADLQISKNARKLNPVALVLPGGRPNAEYYWTAGIRAIQRVIDAHGLDLLLYDTSSPSSIGILRRERAVLQGLLEKAVAGILIFYMGEEWNEDILRRIQQNGTPLVLLERLSPELTCDAVAPDNKGGAYAATSHLIEQGHRRIAHVTVAPPDLALFRERLAGYRRALHDYGISWEESLVYRYQEDWAMKEQAWKRSMADAVAAFWSLDHPPTAILAAHDQCASGLWDALDAVGLRVPEDVALAGFENVLEPGSRGEGAITTLGYNFSDVAALGAELICKRIAEGPAAESEILRQPVRLIVRQSSQRPATNEAWTETRAASVATR